MGKKQRYERPAVVMKLLGVTCDKVSQGGGGCGMVRW